MAEQETVVDETVLVPEALLEEPGPTDADLVRTFDLLLSPMPKAPGDRIRGFLRHGFPSHIAVIDGTTFTMFHADSKRGPAVLAQRGRDVVSFERAGEDGIKKDVLAVQGVTGKILTAVSRGLNHDEMEAIVGIVKDHDRLDEETLADNLRRASILMSLSEDENMALEEARIRLGDIYREELLLDLGSAEAF